MILGRSERVNGEYERLGYKNQPWPPWETDHVPEEDFKKIDPHVFGDGEKTRFRMV
jgi:hypothetical protein